MEPFAVHELPVGRHLAVDERGIGLRATWRLDRGFVNLSLWRGDLCVETFHMTPAAAAELIAFLAGGLADATAVATAATLRSLRPQAPPRQRLLASAAAETRLVRTRIARALTAAASRMDP